MSWPGLLLKNWSCPPGLPCGGVIEGKILTPAAHHLWQVGELALML